MSPPVADLIPPSRQHSDNFPPRCFYLNTSGLIHLSEHRYLIADGLNQQGVDLRFDAQSHRP